VLSLQTIHNYYQISEDFCLETMLAELLQVVHIEAPHLESLFDVFANEARFGWRWLQEDLKELSKGSNVLEVGAGLMLLSCQLVRAGFKVTAVEPFGEGFSVFSSLQLLILKYAKEKGYLPTIISLPIEALTINNTFNFAYSVNVMEHVEDVPLAICNITHALVPGASYRFICANYSFPYEPHFDIPTLFSKNWTKRAFAKKIASNRRVGDPEAVWNSLNWISVRLVAKTVRSIPGLTVEFNRSILQDTLLRVGADPIFSARRSPFIRKLISFAIFFKLHRLSVLIPAIALPLMDCKIIRNR
jgi:hypothetical protein